MPISQEIPQPWATKISLRITYLKFLSNLQGANMLNSRVHGQFYCLAFIQTCKVFCTLTLPSTQCYCQISNTRCTKSQNLNISHLALQLLLPNLLKPGVVLSREWKCSWSSTDRRCSNYIWAVWYKTEFGSQNFGYQLFCNMSNVFENMFNVGLIIMW